MSYQVKEIYYTLQGEGARAGRAAVFLRFAGCNLWSGREKDRAEATCTFCDTDFVGTNGPGGGSFPTPELLVRSVTSKWPKDSAGQPYVVCTGGEPLLQLDDALITGLHEKGFEVGIETNGTIMVPPCLDWICVSPKSDTGLKVTRGNELKLVYPQLGNSPEQFERLDFEHFFLQPLDNPSVEANTRAAISYCLAHPQWRLSLQTHKLIGLR